MEWRSVLSSHIQLWEIIQKTLFWIGHNEITSYDAFILGLPLMWVIFWGMIWKILEKNPSKNEFAKKQVRVKKPSKSGMCKDKERTFCKLCTYRCKLPH